MTLEAGRRSCCRFEHDSIALALEHLNGSALRALGRTAGVVVGAKLVITPPPCEEGIDDDEDRVGDGRDGPLVATMACATSVARRQRRGRRSRGREGGFDQGAPEPVVASARPARLVLAGALVVART